MVNTDPQGKEHVERAFHDLHTRLGQEETCDLDG